MADVAVYHFKVRDYYPGENVTSPRFATLETIKRIKGEPIENTRIIVSDTDLDGNGFYPKQTR